MPGGLVTIFVAQLLFALGATFVISRTRLLAFPAPHLEYALAVFGPAARVGFAVLAVAASASLLNTVLAAAPRMLSGMAANGQAFLALQSSPSAALTGQIVQYTGVVLVTFALVGGPWVKFVMKRGLFEPSTPTIADNRR